MLKRKVCRKAVFARRTDPWFISRPTRRLSNFRTNRVSMPITLPNSGAQRIHFARQMRSFLLLYYLYETAGVG